jgi:NAD(P)-dependent dehydrogenase (short-subunit alcohol dehydrogenase family)
VSDTEIDFTGKNLIVLGAAGHLGRHLCARLVSLGANLVLIDKNEFGLEELKSSLSASTSSNIKTIRCDLEDARHRTEVFSDLIKLYSEVHGLINCASFVGDSKLPGWNVAFENQSIDTWRRAIEVNLTSIFEICQILTPSLKRTKGASIVNIASIYGEKGPRWDLYAGTSLGNPAAYAVSKGGLIQFTRWLATTLAPTVRVNSVIAGGIERDQPDDFKSKYCKDVPLGRMATETDLIGPITFLLSSASSYITGEALHVDGGRGIW